MQFTGNLSGQGNFQMVRQDAPRIGFHLQVGVQARMAAEEGVRFQDETSVPRRGGSGEAYRGMW